MTRFATVTFAAGLCLVSGAAFATQGGQAAIKKWSAMDQCEREAQAAFPDYSVEAVAKRESKLNECLEIHNLPPRAPLSPTH
jgi:gamma-glutamyl phosphate reductase